MQVENDNITQHSGFEQDVATKGAMKKAGAFFFLLMITEIPMAFLVRYVQGVFPESSSTLISVLMTQIYLLLGGSIYMFVTKQSLVKDFRLKPMRLSDFFLSLLLLILSSPMASLLNVVSQFFAKNEMGTAVYSITKQVPVLVGIVLIGCVPGFVEELIYRGILFHAFRKRSIWTGVLVSGISFGLMHMNFNQILYALYLGVLFAMVVEATDSLLSTMLLHMIFNAVNTAQLYILPKFYEWAAQFDASYADFNMEAAMEESATMQQLVSMAVLILPFAVGGVFLSVLLIKAIARRNGKEFTWKALTQCREEVKTIKPVTVCLVLGWVFCMMNAAAAL